MVDDKINDVKKNVKIYVNTDERMRALGTILSTPKSRKIYQILIENELNAKEIGKLLDQEDNPRLPNLVYHLDRMVKVGLLTVKKRQQRKRGHVLKYYKAISVIIIVSNNHFEKATNSKTLFNALQRVFKFSMLGVALFVSAPFFRFFRTFPHLIVK